MDDLGYLVSAFVEERIDSPDPDVIDLWCEGVYAGLFSVAFEAIVRTKEPKSSANAFERAINELIGSISEHASSWVSARCIPEDYDGPPIHIDVRAVIRNRLVTYFDAALCVAADRGYQLSVARSHACFALLERAVTELITQGQVTDPQRGAASLRKSFDASESFAQEIAATLEHRPR